MEAPIFPRVSAAADGRVSPAPLWMTAVLVFALGVTYAFYKAFSGPLSQDEGFLMITVQSFLEGHPLYDVVFTQYGPVYYFYEWLLHRALAVPLTHDATRFVCMFHWMIAAGLLGFAGARMTRSAAGGLFVFMQAVMHLAPLANEAGHPQEVVAMLQALSLLVASRVEHAGRGVQMAMLAMLGTSLFFIKINVGVFFLLALFLPILFQQLECFRRGTLVWLLIASCAILPFMLMRRFIIYDWCRNYGLLVASTWIATSLIAKDSDANGSATGWRLWLLPAGAAAVTTLAWLGIALLAGTSLHGLLDGIVLTPLRLADAAVWPVQVPTFGLLNVAGSLVLAAFIFVNPSHPWRTHIVTLFKALFGTAVSIIFVGQSHAQLKYLLPWIWLVLVTSPDQPQGEGFARMFLAFASIWQSLQAYPIAGTQVAIATLFLPVAGVVCAADALRALRVPELVRSRIAAWPTRRILLGQTAAAIAAVGLFVFGWCELLATRRHFASLRALDLPGSGLIRGDAETIDLYRSLAQYLEVNCETFLTSPAMNSFYFWARKHPPTHLNATTLSILTAQQEEQLMTALKRSGKPLIVAIEGTMTADEDNKPVMVAESTGEPAPARTAVPLRPVMRALRDEFVEVHRIPPFRIYAPKRQPQ
jgi:hypothetical protein